ncbi:MAG TPA: BBE domain-containing protein [Anaerolineaceae bacterium]|nr:BBE domain-containing protein [Anaerolineaceae bacterium]
MTNRDRISLQTILSVEQLRADFPGRVIAPGEAGYDRARTVFYSGFDQRPAVILRPADAGDIARMIALAREGEARVREAYPTQTWERLTGIKRRYDPANLFHLNQNIPPSGERS